MLFDFISWILCVGATAAGKEHGCLCWIRPICVARAGSVFLNPGWDSILSSALQGRAQGFGSGRVLRCLPQVQAQF